MSAFIIYSLWTATGLSLLLTVVEVFAASRKLRRHPVVTAPERVRVAGLASQHASDPLVSILKPLCGADEGLAENLELFATLDDRFETIFSIADPRDPAVSIVRSLVERNPHARLLCQIGHRDATVTNPKVERLIAAAEVASGHIFFISDGQVRATAEDLERTIGALRDRSIGCVSNLFVGEGARSLGAMLESSHLLTFVLAGNVLAALGHVPCVVGKSMAVPRTALDRVGGFRRFANVLAEDQAIAVALRNAGYRLLLASTVVRNYVERKSVSAALDRQVRWNKIRYAFSRTLYFAELLMNPTALIVAASVLTLAAGMSATWLLVSAGALMVRIAAAALLLRRSRPGSSFVPVAVIPLQEMLQFFAWFVPFFSDRVNWRGTRARLGRGTLILPIAARDGLS